ncbi:hypothetical protein L4C36_21940, partial [Photobacterium japonica]|uniref:hypothetical protein n=1 Tax=Photobacterium japonica TaxID=2910235 RepID=UPI003D0D3AA6
PNLSYSYKINDAKPTIASFFKIMKADIKHEIELVGLPVDSDLFTITLERSRIDPDMLNKVALRFEDLGETKNTMKTAFGSSGTPTRKDAEDCKRMIIERGNSTLFGLLGGISAVNNVVSVGVR